MEKRQEFLLRLGMVPERRQGSVKGPCKGHGQQLYGCDQWVLRSQRGKLQADNDLKKFQRPHDRTDTQP